MTNTGDIPTPILVHVFGPCSAFELTNLSTKQSLPFAGALAPGQALVVSTEPGRQTAVIVDRLTHDGRPSTANAIPLIPLDAEFWLLEPGVNNILFVDSTDDDDDRQNPGRALIEWSAGFVGL